MINFLLLKHSLVTSALYWIGILRLIDLLYSISQVVCRQLGFSNLNVFLDFDRRIEFHAQSINRIIYWPEPYQCTGRESRLSHCDLRMNGQIYGHLYGCDWEGTDFVFVNCGETNLDSDYEYWGGVRFSVKEFEQELFHARIHDAVTHSSHKKHDSILEYVQVYFCS